LEQHQLGSDQIKLVRNSISFDQIKSDEFGTVSV
jgi:hypothetical protein